MLIRAASQMEIPHVRKLFLEYAESLGFSLCFQGFQQEVDELPGRYAPPEGTLLLAWEDNMAIGVAGLRKFDTHSAEMKRLYVQPDHRGKSIGKKLAERIILDATRMGYQSIKLDTVPSMQAARHLYAQLGFQIIPAYYQNSECDSICMELRLNNVRNFEDVPSIETPLTRSGV